MIDFTYETLLREFEHIIGTVGELQAKVTRARGSPAESA